MTTDQIEDGQAREQLLQHLTDPRHYDHGRFCLIQLAHMSLLELQQFVEDCEEAAR
jgi:hypothetical protein